MTIASRTTCTLCEGKGIKIDMVGNRLLCDWCIGFGTMPTLIQQNVLSHLTLK